MYQNKICLLCYVLQSRTIKQRACSTLIPPPKYQPKQSKSIKLGPNFGMKAKCDQKSCTRYALPLYINIYFNSMINYSKLDHPPESIKIKVEGVIAS